MIANLIVNINYRTTLTTTIRMMRTVVTFPKRWYWLINTSVSKCSVNANSCVPHCARILNACVYSVVST